MSTWEENERAASGPAAAPLEDCAELLGVPLEQLRQVAAQVKPYRHAAGHNVWSLYLLDRAMHPERYGRSTGGAPTRRRAGSRAG